LGRRRTTAKSKVYGMSKPKPSKVVGRLPNDFRHTSKWQKFREMYLADPRNARCAYCGREATTIDHVKPLSKYAEIDCFDQSNMLPCCSFCQNSKKDLDYKEWRKKQMDGIDIAFNGIPPCPEPREHMIAIGMTRFY
jgi:5-methylcytosine-specific restriction endonuclease McrA